MRINPLPFSLALAKYPCRSAETSGIGGEGGDGEGRVPGVGRGPVTWGALALFALAGALLVGYYRTEKEKRESRVSSQVRQPVLEAFGGAGGAGGDMAFT